MREGKRILSLMLAIAIVLSGFNFTGLGFERSEVKADGDLITIEVTSLSAGEYHTTALKSDGTVWSWGSNETGQLGEGTTTSRRTTPVQVKNLTGIVNISAGDMHTTALKLDGTVWSWGWNLHGKLGDGTTTNRHTPVRVNNLTDIVDISGGSYHTIALKSDGTVWSWGNNSSGQLGDGTRTRRSTPVQAKNLTDIIDISAGTSHTTALKSDGTVWSWGWNRDGQLGDGTTTNRHTPVQVNNLTDIVNISAGEYHTTALKSDGTVWSWGSNETGQLGEGTTTSRRTTPVQAKNLTDIIDISAGSGHTTALKSDGTVWSWGSNSSGQLGDGTTTRRSTPERVNNLTDIVDISAGTSHTTALKTDGTVWSWGWNRDGQLGDGTTTNRHTPVQVNNLTQVRNLTGVNIPKGDGSESNPYKITKISEFNYMGFAPTSHYVLESDIVAEDTIWVIVTFSGTLDGKGNKLIFNEKNEETAFGILNNAGTIKNLTVEYVSDKVIPGLVRTNTKTGIIENVMVTSNKIKTVTQNTGLIAQTNAGTIRGSLIDLNLSESTEVTKLSGIAHTNNGSIEDSVVIYGNEGQTNVPQSAFAYTGTGTINRSAFIGGKAKTLIGDADSTLKVFDSYVNGGKLESLTGDSADPKVNLQYVYVAISPQSEANAVQEVAGRTGSIMKNSYFNISGVSDGRRSLTQLKDIETYEWWDFDEVWDIDPLKNGGFPFLRNQPKPEDFEPAPKGIELEVGLSNTEWTNQDIEVTVNIKNGKGSELITLPDESTVAGITTKFTVSENGSYTVKGNDSEGKEVEKIIEVTNIDKVNPTEPKLSVTGQGKIKIELGTDTLSGIKEHKYKLNEGEWVNTFDIGTLENGEYTLEVKAIDKATNESAVAKIKFTKTGEEIEEVPDVDPEEVKLNEAKLAVQNAEQSEKQADYDIAKEKVDALGLSQDKNDLHYRLQLLEVEIALNEAEIAITLFEITGRPQDYEDAMLKLAKALTLLNNCPEESAPFLVGMLQKLGLISVVHASTGLTKNDLLNRFNNLDVRLKVKQAEVTKDPTDIEDAKEAIDKLPSGTDKDGYAGRVDNVEEGVKQEQIQGVENEVGVVQDVIDNLPSKPTEGVIQNAQDKINDLQDQVNQLPNGVDKDRLQGVVDGLQDQLDQIKKDKKEQEKIEDADRVAGEIQDEIDGLVDPTEGVIQNAQDKINDLQDQVNQLPNGVDKDRLQGVVDDLQNQLDAKKFASELKKGIEINQGDLDIVVGQKSQLTHTSKLGVEWKSSDNTVATVTQQGNVSGIRAGNAVITVTIKGTEVKDSINVSVENKEIKVTGFEITEDTKELKVRESYTLNYRVSPEDATNKRVRWESDNPEIASVVAGRITGIGAGTTTVTGTTLDGEFVDSVIVTVVEDKEQTDVKLTVEKLDKDIWGNRVRLKISVEGDYREIVLPDGNKVYNRTFNYTIRENGTYAFSVKGKDGISVDSEVVEIDNIDKKAPIITFSIDPENIERLTVNVIEEESGIDKLTTPLGKDLSEAMLPYIMEQAEQGTYIARDLAGNVSTKEYYLNKVNIGGRESHTYIAIDGVPTEWTNENVVVRVGAQNNVDGVDELNIGVTNKIEQVRMYSGQTEPTEGTEPTGNEPQGNESTEGTEPTGNESQGNEPTAEEPTGNEPQGNEPTGNEPQGNESTEGTEPTGKESQGNESTEGTEPTGNEPQGNEPTGEEPVGNEPQNKKYTQIEEVELSINGTINYKVKNKFGEYQDGVEVNKIDKEKPSIIATVEGKTVSYIATDNLSGVKVIELPKGDIININTDGQLEFAGAFEMEANGIFTIVVEDYAGNKTETTIELNFEPGEEPADPEKPGEGEEPEKPGEGEEPEKPGEGEEPEKPGEGEEPEKPGEGEEPEKPGEGEDPEKPGEGEDPEKPGEGKDPEKPGEGKDPEKPGEGEEPEKPGEGEDPEKPGEGEDLEKPGEGEDPEKPEDPEEPVLPPVDTKTEVKVEKVWVGVGRYERVPTIEIDLLANGVYKDTITLKEGETTYTFKDLPKTDDAGKEIVYRVTEDKIKGFDVSYKINGYEHTITNTKKYHDSEIDIRVEKEWKGLDRGEKVPTIRIDLLKNGRYHDRVTLKDGETRYTFRDLEEYDREGYRNDYTVEEEKVEGFKTKYRENRDTWVITNTKEGTETTTEETRDGKMTKTEYTEAEIKLVKTIPYTILKGSKFNWSEITGIDEKHLKVEIDTDKIGLQEIKVTLDGKTQKYTTEVVELLVNEKAYQNAIRETRWSKDYVRDVVNKGYITGDQNGSLLLRNTLTFADSFTALDRLLLRNNQVKLNIRRDEIEAKLPNMPKDRWYSYPGLSIYSKYTDITKVQDVNMGKVITREEIAEIIYNSFKGVLPENVESKFYKDTSAISKRNQVEFVTKAGIMEGDDTGNFNPQESITREEYMAVLSRIDTIIGMYGTK